jgi:hypothetical protein
MLTRRIKYELITKLIAQNRLVSETNLLSLINPHCEIMNKLYIQHDMN